MTKGLLPYRFIVYFFPAPLIRKHSQLIHVR